MAARSNTSWIRCAVRSPGGRVVLVQLSASVHPVRRQGRGRDGSEVVGGDAVDPDAPAGARLDARDSVKPGDTLTVTYSPHRTAPNVGFARRLVVNGKFLDEGCDAAAARARGGPSGVRNHGRGRCPAAGADSRDFSGHWDRSSPIVSFGNVPSGARARTPACRRRRSRRRDARCARNEPAGLRAPPVHAAERSARPMRAARPGPSSHDRNHRAS